MPNATEETPSANPDLKQRGPAFKKMRSEFVDAVLNRTMVPEDLPAKYSAAVDEWLREVFASAARDKPRGCVLLAVGGYGRGELYPGSDLDLVLLHHARRDYQRVAHETWYAIWDAGVHLDHSVRTRREAVNMATSDLKVMLGLLDARVVAGDEKVAERLLEEIPDVWRRNAKTMLRDFDHQVKARHEQFGDVAFLLEPDLKNSSGGLRDLAALRALGIAFPQTAPLVDQPAIAESERVIMAARVALHCRTNNSNDRLLLQEQDKVTEIMGISDADALMAEISEAGRVISSASSEAWRRARAEVQGLAPAHAAAFALGNGVILHNGGVALDATADVANPELIVAIGRASIEHNVPIELETLNRLAEKAQSPSDPWSTTLREGFVALLSSGPPMIAVVEALDQHHLFELLLPEWHAVRNRPQRNAFHRYTVDRHLLETVSLCAAHVDMVARPDLLIMGALLHDIGKGYPGDHSEVGKALATTIATRMGFSEKDIETIANLVSYHLVVPEFSIRRDLDDPSTAIVVAKLVGDVQTLELLATLTEVDSVATGTAAWGPWKADLVKVLVERVTRVLEGQPVTIRPFAPTTEQAEMLAAGDVAIRATGRKVTVVAPDRPGLLAKVAGVLALHGCNVKRATAEEGSPGMAIEIFMVEPAFEKLPQWDVVEKELVKILDNSDSLSERLTERDATYSRSRRPAAALPVKAHVKIDNDTSALSSIIQVVAPDRIGLLHDISTSLQNEELDVLSALIDTLGHEVVDTFYVHNSSGEKLQPQEIDAVSRSLESVIARV